MEREAKIMVLDTIYRNPTVKQVIFQITFPNLFYLEKRIGDIQEQIMREFPESRLLLKNRIWITDTGPEQKIEIPSDEMEKNASRKIWQFESRNKTILSIALNSLDISSEFYKTYKLGDDESKKFRHAIEYAVGNFLQIIKLPTINRIGLRYIDQCPLPHKDNETLTSWYNSKFPLNKFNIADATSMTFRTIVKRGGYNLGYVESLQQINGENKLVLDFDGFAMDIDASDYLAVTDDLHDMISKEYAATIREPVFDYMNRQED